MGRLQHEKINRRVLVAKDLPKPKQRQPKSKWLTLPFHKKFPGYTAIDLFFRALWFFAWVITEDIIGSSTCYDDNPDQRELVASQVNDVADRAARILPPGPCREAREFVIV